MKSDSVPFFRPLRRKPLAARLKFEVLESIDMDLIVTCTINWSEFDGDLLKLILSNLCGKDRLSFSLVCKHWNAVAEISPRCSPCLVYYYWRAHTWIFYEYNTFFSMNFPELEDAEIRCSMYGWLLMSRYDDTLFFFHPSNNQKIELPCKIDPLHYPLSFINPPTSPECVVVGIKTLSSCEKVEIRTLKRGEHEWECMKFTIEPGNNFMVLPGTPVLHNGLIYFLSVDGDVAIFDIKEKTLDIDLDCLYPGSDEFIDIREQYLVKVNGEEALYGVFVFDEEREVKVFKFSADMKVWDLVEEGIGDRVFYISPNSCYGEKAPSESMENTIYFPMFHGDSPVFYSLNDSKYHSLDGAYSEDNAYGLKRLNRAAWLTPMPAEEASTKMSWDLDSDCETI